VLPPEQRESQKVRTGEEGIALELGEA
jgi:hypothetical protein